MTNEEKAREIAESCSVMPLTPITQADVIAMTNNAAMQALELKDMQHEQEKQKLIDEAAKWIRTHKYMYENEYVMANDFKKAMEGE